MSLFGIEFGVTFRHGNPSRGVQCYRYAVAI